MKSGSGHGRESRLRAAASSAGLQKAAEVTVSAFCGTEGENPCDFGRTRVLRKKDILQWADWKMNGETV